jgi:hypothetical protein
MTVPLIHVIAVLLLSGLLMLFGKAKFGLLLVHIWIYYIGLTINREELLGSGELSPSSTGHIVLVVVAAAAIIMTALGLFTNKE